MTRTKWKTQNRNFQINDLVIIKEDNMPPSHLRLGRILEVFPSKDGLVRAVRCGGRILSTNHKIGTITQQR